MPLPLIPLAILGGSALIGTGTAVGLAYGGDTITETNNFSTQESIQNNYTRTSFSFSGDVEGLNFTQNNTPTVTQGVTQEGSSMSSLFDSRALIVAGALGGGYLIYSQVKKKRGKK